MIIYKLKMKDLKLSWLKHVLVC